MDPSSGDHESVYFPSQAPQPSFVDDAYFPIQAPHVSSNSQTYFPAQAPYPSSDDRTYFPIQAPQPSFDDDAYFPIQAPHPSFDDQTYFPNIQALFLSSDDQTYFPTQAPYASSNDQTKIPIQAPQPSFEDQTYFPIQAPSLFPNDQESMYFPIVAPPPPRVNEFQQNPVYPPPNNRRHQTMMLDPVPHSQLLEIQKQQMDLFWKSQRQELDNLEVYMQHHFPLSRIKKVMKLNKAVQKVSADSSVIFSKACELFIKDITMRSWLQTESNRKTTIRKADIAKALLVKEEYGFLMDTVTGNENKDEEAGPSGAQG